VNRSDPDAMTVWRAMFALLALGCALGLAVAIPMVAFAWAVHRW
jgi:hypothetical protein